MALPADTYNWDTVFAIKFPDVNAAITKAATSPKTFNYADTSNPDDTVTINGTFSHWQLALGGAGQNVWMSVPIPTGTLTRVVTDPVTKQKTTTTLDLTGVTATIQVTLDLLPQPGATAVQGKQNLKVKTKATAGSAVTVQKVTYPAGVTADVILDSLLKLGLGIWFNGNLQQFNHVFATVDLNMKADQDGLQWLMPTHTGYAVITENKTLEESVFGVLSMTEGREKLFANLAHQVSPNAIPSGSRSGFLIATERFLSKMVLPGIHTLFMGATQADFDVQDNGTTILNINQLNTQKFRLNDGKEISPEIDAKGFKLTVANDKLHLVFDSLHFEYTAGMDAYIKFESYGSIALDEKHRIVAKMETGSTKGSTVTASPGVEAANIALGIALLIAGAIIGMCLPGEGEVVGEAGAELAEDGTTYALNDLNATVTNDTGGIGSSAENANPITGSAMEMADTLAGDANASTSMTGWFARNWKKVGMVVGAALVGGGVAPIFTIVEAAQQGNLDAIPTLDTLAGTAVSPVIWPGTSQYTLASAGLNTSLQIGGDPGFIS